MQKCLNALGEKVDTGLRAVTGGYYRCLDPGKAERGADDFPVQFRPHGRSPLRSLMNTRRELLCHEIALAFLAYRGQLSGKDVAAQEQISRLELIVKEYPALFVIGNDREGWRLATPTEHAKLEQGLEEAEARKWAEEDKER